MKIENRTDGIRITGYVNVTGKKSRPVLTPYGRVIEIIEERAFENTLSSGSDVIVTVDHNSDVYASISGGTLKLKEDAIGLRADVMITDNGIINAAKSGKIKGWSFGMKNIKDELEQRAEGELPIRHVKAFDLDHITLVINKMPVYAATSVEYRSDDEINIETRSFDTGVEFSNFSVESSTENQKIDYSEYKNKIKKYEKE